MFVNGSKGLETDVTGRQWIEKAGNGQKWLEIVNFD